MNSQKGDFLIARKHALTIEEVVKGIKMRHYSIELFLYVITLYSRGFTLPFCEQVAIYETGVNILEYLYLAHAHCKIRVPFNIFCGNVCGNVHLNSKKQLNPKIPY